MAKEKKVPELCPRVVLEMAQGIIEEFHPHLKEAEIRYVFMPRMSRHGRVVLGRATKLGGVPHLLSGADFVVCLNLEEWDELSDESRVAVLDHELCHCGPLDGDVWTMRDHDLAEFREIVTRHGLWDACCRRFVDVVRQMGLFEREPVGV